MKNKAMSLVLAGTLAFGALGAVACDKEDRKDVEEVGNDIDKGVDNLDSDGKDD